MSAFVAARAHPAGRERQPGADAARTQRLRAHSKRAWDLYNGLMAVGELDRYYGPLLAAHIYLTRGRPGHTTSQRDVARLANLPLDRVKDQMHRLEAMGMLTHEREGNRWRTTLLPFLPVDAALQILARARSCSDGAATAYLIDLAELGVRLPWALGHTGIRTSPPAGGSRGDAGDDIRALLDAARLAHECGDVLAALEHVSRVAHALQQANSTLPGEAHDGHATPLPTTMDTSQRRHEERAGDRSSDPRTIPARHTAHPPAGPPQSMQTRAVQCVKRASLNQSHDPNRESESLIPPQPSDLPNAQGRGGTKKQAESDSSATVGSISATVRALVAEGVYPKNVRRFADLPPAVVLAAASATGLPAGHAHRAGRLVERLEAYRSGLWQPLPAVGNASPHPHSGTSGGQATPGHVPGQAGMQQGAQHGSGHLETGSSTQDALWAAVLDDMAQGVPASEFATWLHDTRLLALSGSRAVVGTANVFARDTIAATFGEQLARVVSERCGRRTELEIVIG